MFSSVYVSRCLFKIPNISSYLDNHTHNVSCLNTSFFIPLDIINLFFPVHVATWPGLAEIINTFCPLNKVKLHTLTHLPFFLQSWYPRALVTVITSRSCPPKTTQNFYHTHSTSSILNVSHPASHRYPDRQHFARTPTRPSSHYTPSPTPARIKWCGWCRVLKKKEKKAKKVRVLCQLGCWHKESKGSRGTLQVLSDQWFANYCEN